MYCWFLSFILSYLSPVYIITEKYMNVSMKALIQAQIFESCPNLQLFYEKLNVFFIFKFTQCLGE